MSRSFIEKSSSSMVHVQGFGLCILDSKPGQQLLVALFWAIRPLIGLLVPPEQSIVIVIVIRGDPPPTKSVTLGQQAQRTMICYTELRAMKTVGQARLELIAVKQT